MSNKVTLNRAKDGMLTYRYIVDGIGVCQFHLLSEVGQAWQAEFKAIIAERGYTIVQKEAPKPIYFADYVQ